VLAVSPDPVVLLQPPRRHALERVHQPRDRDLRRVGDQQVHVVVVTIALHQPRAEVGAHVREHPTEQVKMVARQHPTPILGDEDHVHVQRRNNVPTRR
jgi:hypothetical protein